MIPDRFPLEAETLTPDENGNYHIIFAVKNDSEAAAQAIEVWADVCDLCSFAGEPKGFDRPQGMPDRERHRSIPEINPGVTVIQGNEIDVKPPFSSGKFSILFKATCNECGSVTISKQFWVTESEYPTLQ